MGPYPVALAILLLGVPASLASIGFMITEHQAGFASRVIFPNGNLGRPLFFLDKPRYYDRPTRSNDDNPLLISSEIMDYDTQSITVREGRKLMVRCVFDSDEEIHKSDLNWKKSGGHNIDGETSPSLFALILNEKGSRHKKSSLHFTSIHQRDSGMYVCTARTVGGQHFEKTIRINVLAKLEWNNPATEIGALLGEPLTVDCGVKSNGKEPLIQMTNSSGEPLNENIFTIAGNEATIESLAKEHSNIVVSCVTIEMIGEGADEYPVVDRKDVTIEVYHLPEFATEESTQYTVVDNNDRHVEIHCNVTSSFPIARHFTFYHGDEEIKPSDKYSIMMDVGYTQGAHLHIYHVDENDLGTYRCEVNNGKAKSHHNIHLREASSPAEPRVTLLKTSRNSITWQIENSEKNPDMPITAIEIRYMRSGSAEASGVADSEMDNDYWVSHSSLVQRDIEENDVYEITGLRHAHEYVWRFRNIGEAGFGDSVVVRAKTFDEDDKYMSSTSSLYSVMLSIVLACMALII